MKKLLAVLLISCMAITFLGGCGGAEPNQDDSSENVQEGVSEPVQGESSAEDTWYELENGVLTLRLKANDTTGYRWDFEVADPTLVEMITNEYIPDEVDENVRGAGGQWVASFRGLEGDGGQTQIILKYARGEQLSQTRDILCAVDADGNITQVIEANVVDEAK